jgi:hypothetical protein
MLMGMIYNSDYNIFGGGFCLENLSIDLTIQHKYFIRHKVKEINRVDYAF